MNYERINNLLEKYWQCATTIEEESELRRFFATAVIPPDLLPYKTWFVSSEAEMLQPLDDHFDAQVMQHIEQLRRRRRQQAVTRYICYGSLFFALTLLILCVKLFLF